MLCCVILCVVLCYVLDCCMLCCVVLCCVGGVGFLEWSWFAPPHTSGAAKDNGDLSSVETSGFEVYGVQLLTGQSQTD